MMDKNEIDEKFKVVFRALSDIVGAVKTLKDAVESQNGMRQTQEMEVEDMAEEVESLKGKIALKYGGMDNMFVREVLKSGNCASVEERFRKTKDRLRELCERGVYI
jgi:hypothetical protein